MLNTGNSSVGLYSNKTLRDNDHLFLLDLTDFMTRKSLLLLVFILLISTPIRAQQQQPPPGTFLFDIILFRPVSFIATVAGTAAFVGLSPLTAFASIPYPHDAFDRTAEFLIKQPARYTFQRPLGVYYPDEFGGYTVNP